MSGNNQIALQVSSILVDVQMNLQGWVGQRGDSIAMVVAEQMIDEIGLMTAIQHLESRLQSKVSVFRSTNLSPAEMKKMLAEYVELDTSKLESIRTRLN